jgi:hypothetical protein
VDGKLGSMTEGVLWPFCWVHVWENFELFFWALSYIDLVLASYTHQVSQSNKTQQECDRQTRMANRKWVEPRIAFLYTWGFTQEGLPTPNGDQCVVNNFFYLFLKVCWWPSQVGQPQPDLKEPIWWWPTWNGHQERMCTNYLLITISSWPPSLQYESPFLFITILKDHLLPSPTILQQENIVNALQFFPPKLMTWHDDPTKSWCFLRFTIYTWFLIDLDSMFTALHICVPRPYIQSCPIN